MTGEFWGPQRKILRIRHFISCIMVIFCASIYGTNVFNFLKVKDLYYFYDFIGVGGQMCRF